MARARNIKPSFFKNEDLAELPFSTRLLFIGLWMLADREGRLEDRPKRIKMEVFPGDDANVEKGLSELHASGFIQRYEANGSRFIEVCAFLKHQNPHHREPPSIIPKPQALPPLQPPTSPRLEVDATPPKPKESPGPAPELPGLAVLIPESPSLNPESREKALSGKPDVAAKGNGKRHHRAEALEVIEHLNASAHRAYQPVAANLALIEARLNEGATVNDCKAVITDRCGKWAADPKMAEYLRPATLFNATKFAQYRGELGAPDDWRQGMI